MLASYPSLVANADAAIRIGLTRLILDSRVFTNGNRPVGISICIQANGSRTFALAIGPLTKRQTILPLCFGIASNHQTRIAAGPVRRADGDRVVTAGAVIVIVCIVFWGVDADEVRPGLLELADIDGILGAGAICHLVDLRIG